MFSTFSTIKFLVSDASLQQATLEDTCLHYDRLDRLDRLVAPGSVVLVALGWIALGSLYKYSPRCHRLGGSLAAKALSGIERIPTERVTSHLFKKLYRFTKFEPLAGMVLGSRGLTAGIAVGGAAAISYGAFCGIRAFLHKFFQEGKVRCHDRLEELFFLSPPPLQGDLFGFGLRLNNGQEPADRENERGNQEVELEHREGGLGFAEAVQGGSTDRVRGQGQEFEELDKQPVWELGEGFGVSWAWVAQDADKTEVVELPVTAWDAILSFLELRPVGHLMRVCKATKGVAQRDGIWNLWIKKNFSSMVGFLSKIGKQSSVYNQACILLHSKLERKYAKRLRENMLIEKASSEEKKPVNVITVLNILGYQASVTVAADQTLQEALFLIHLALYEVGEKKIEDEIGEEKKYRNFHYSTSASRMRLFQGSKTSTNIAPDALLKDCEFNLIYPLHVVVQPLEKVLESHLEE